WGSAPSRMTTEARDRRRQGHGKTRPPAGLFCRSSLPRTAAGCYQDGLPGRARMATAATFEIEYLQYLGPDGRLVRDDLPDFATDGKTLVELFKQMLLVRSFDTKAVALQRTGKLGT